MREVIRRVLRLKQLSLPRLVGIICPDNWEGPPQSWPESPESQGLCWAGSLLGSPQCKPSGGSDFFCWLLHSLCPLLSAQDEILKVRTDTKLNFNLEKSRVKELVCSFIKSKSLIYFFSEWNACWSLSLLCKIQLSLDTRPFIRVHNLSLNFNYISHQIPHIGAHVALPAHHFSVGLWSECVTVGDEASTGAQTCAASHLSCGWISVLKLSFVMQSNCCAQWLSLKYLWVSNTPLLQREPFCGLRQLGFAAVHLV